jgi:hypothetical protein
VIDLVAKLTTERTGDGEQEGPQMHQGTNMGPQLRGAHPAAGCAGGCRAQQEDEV